jgi:murein DD-endopeptidase MepM/ murein hydrolase activator NlpD
MSARTTHSPARLIGRAVILGALISLFVFPAYAHAAKSEKQLQEQLADIRSDLKKAGSEYDAAFWRLDETDVRLSQVETDIEATEQELANSRALLSDRVARAYRSDATDYLTVLFEVSSFQEMATRVEYLQRIGEADAQTIEQCVALQTELEARQTELDAEREERAAAVKELDKQKAALEKRLASKKAEYDEVQRELAAQARRNSAASSRSYASASSYGAPGANGMIFPVQGANYYSDTWGASRGGGRRRHKGTDIMAAPGTPCVAVLSGSVRTKSNGLGGKTIWLTADNGMQFYYAHMQGYAVSGGRVNAGQVIGYVGSSGNASASAPHLHFQIHPGGGSAVNPYPYLRQMQ